MQSALLDLILDIKASESREVDSMVKRINSALLERANFEREKAPHKSHVELRRVAAQFADSRNVAAFFVALNVDPWIMFNKVRKNGWRTNLKGLQKVRRLVDYVMGNKPTLDMDSTALFAATIIAANKGIEWISSSEQEFILSSESINSLPKDIAKTIHEFQSKRMTIEGGSRPHSCEWRTTYANMGLYTYSREEVGEDDYSLGVHIDLTNPLIIFLNETWGLSNV